MSVDTAEAPPIIEKPKGKDKPPAKQWFDYLPLETKEALTEQQRKAEALQEEARIRQIHNEIAQRAGPIAVAEAARDRVWPTVPARDGHWYPDPEWYNKPHKLPDNHTYGDIVELYIDRFVTHNLGHGTLEMLRDSMRGLGTATWLPLPEGVRSVFKTTADRVHSFAMSEKNCRRVGTAVGAGLVLAIAASAIGFL